MTVKRDTNEMGNAAFLHHLSRTGLNWQLSERDFLRKLLELLHGVFQQLHDYMKVSNTTARSTLNNATTKAAPCTGTRDIFNLAMSFSSGATTSSEK